MLKYKRDYSAIKRGIFMKINSSLLQVTGLKYQAKTIKTKNTEPVEPENKVILSGKIFQSEETSEKMPKLIELPRCGKYQRSKTFTMEDGKGSTITGTKKAGSSSPVALAMFDTEKPDISEHTSLLNKIKKFTLNLTGRITGHLIPSTILDDVPDGRQDRNYSCGAVALQTVLTYWKGQEYFEEELIELLHTTENGTLPEDIVRVAKEEGLSAELKEHMTIEELEKLVGEGIPVIVDGQAWRDDTDKEKPWTEVWESGHYMVVIGFDKENVYFEDPSLFGSRGVMTREEFNDRWHDYEGPVPFNEKTARVYNHTGIVIKGDKPSPPPQFVHID